MMINPKTASITELRQNATALLDAVQESQEPIFILQHSKKAAVLLDGETFEKLVEAAGDQRDYEIAEAAMREKPKKTYTWKDIDKMRLRNL